MSLSVSSQFVVQERRTPAGDISLVISPAGAAAKYCDECVCLSVYMSVCRTGYLRNHMRDLYQFFVHVACLPVSMARSSSKLAIGHIAYRREGIFFPVDNAL